jgi:type II secretory pathway component PulK
MPRSRNRRRAAALIAALVALVIVTSILGSMLLGSLAIGRQLHAERDRRQCELLLQAGVDRAAVRRQHETDYRGETWTVPAPDIIGAGNGQVTIRIESGSSSAAQKLHVVAEYPTGSERSVRRSRTISLPPNTP